ncbi:MAG: hypothetical protein HC869_05840 [Rhodospirillales bacterium]|nr:hypothetical protein [Rhodospirillales bacterium]
MLDEPVEHARETGHSGQDGDAANLVNFIKQWMKKRKKRLRAGAAEEFVRRAERRTQELLSEVNVRASDSNRQLKAFYEGIQQAWKHLESAGPRGKRHVIAAVSLHESAPSDDDFGPKGISFIHQLNGVAPEALEDLEAEWLELPERKGGRTPNYRLQGLALAVAQDFETLLELSPGHANNDNTPSFFDQVFKQILKAFAPPEFFRSGDGSIAAAIKRATTGLRNLEDDPELEQEL